MARQALVILLVVIAFGILVPIYKGFAFLDARIILAYACLSLLFVAPASAELAATHGKDASPSQLLTRIAVIVAWGPEIAEAGEEIEGIVEAVRAKDLPHVVNVEIQVIVAEPAGIFDTGGRQVDACHIIALIGEDPGVAPSSAGHIQHPRCGWRVEQGQQAMDEGGCLLFVSFKVQFMVIG